MAVQQPSQHLVDRDTTSLKAIEKNLIRLFLYCSLLANTRSDTAEWCATLSWCLWVDLLLVVVKEVVVMIALFSFVLLSSDSLRDG